MERDVSKKLTNLLKLQEIDSKIFDLKTIRGALPQEVQDLEDELEGYNTRLDNHTHFYWEATGKLTDAPGNFLEISKRTIGLFVAPLFVLFAMSIFVPFATSQATILAVLPWAAAFAPRMLGGAGVAMAATGLTETSTVLVVMQQ